MKLNVDKIYICHYTKLVERKKSIINQLDNIGVNNYEFVEFFDKDNLFTDEILKNFPKIHNIENNMTLGEKSLALKHAWIIKDVHDKNYSSVLVLEDDAILCDNFIQYFNYYKNQLPLDWDIGWVGSCFNLKEPQIPNCNVYKTDRGSRCTHAFCISKQFTQKVYNEIKNINRPSDHYYNYLVKTFLLNNYWFQPALALQSLDFCSALNADPNHKWEPHLMG
jgi:GR25 family glycosyltransferase involved in LPS biosynthesis